MWVDVALVLSGPSLFDQFSLPMSFEYMFKKNNCQAQLNELDRRTDEAAPILRRSLLKRCSSIHSEPQWQNKNFVSNACPCMNLHPLAHTVIQAANALKVGVLPYSGGMLDQPAILMDMIQMAQIFLQEHEEKVMKESQKKSARR